MAFDIKRDCLTPCAGATMIPLPFPHEAVGSRSPFTPGQKMTAPLAVFFRLSFRAGLIRFFSVMAGLFGHTSVWPRLVAVLRTHSNPPPKLFAVISGGLSIFTRINRMKNHSSRANVAQNPTAIPLFSIYWHRQCLRIGIAGALAMRIKRRFPACIVKFSGFEGGAV